MSDLRTYSKLISFHTFEERLEYLRIGKRVGDVTFGSDRYLNQAFYHSREWLNIKDFVITRDLGCDLAILDREIVDRIYVHHMNPMSRDRFKENVELFLDPEYLICCSFSTHQAIHYGTKVDISYEPVIRRPYDTCLWKN